MTWVLIVIGLIIVLGLVFFLVRKRREQQLEEKRVQAGELRQEASTTARQAEQARLAAEEQAERARKAQATAEERRREADELDPDVEVDDDAGDRGRTT
jgi:LPXTG-motif cell wall-anchored protein